MSVSSKQKTSGELAKERIRKQGLTIKSWSHQKGLNYRVVSEVLRGVNKGNFGEGHRAAVELGMKK